MCGICGIIDPHRAPPALRATLEQMADTIVHRGPDDAGYFCAGQTGLGMRRLSIIDVAGGQQPISNEDGQVQVVFNGEIYNHVQLRADLQSRGHVFKTQADTEVIAHLYEEKGVACLEDLRGMFGIAIFDQRNQRVVLARDRLGKKPLFYAQLGDRFLFGSEIKALLAAEPSLAEPSRDALLEYMRFGYVAQPRTVFKNVRKLPSASYLIFEHGEITIGSYWEVDYGPSDATANGDAKTAGQWAEELDSLLEAAVQLRLMSEVPLGVFLSGGLDSSAIVAYAHRAGLDPLKTFTIGFDRPEWDESDDAQIVADHFQTEHHVLHLAEADMKRDFPQTVLELVRHFDEPFADQSSLPTYMVSKLAREHVTVILSGDGGDELFAGYNSYQGIKFAEQYRRLPGWLGGKLLPSVAGVAAHCLPAKQRYAANRIRRVLNDSSLPFEHSYYNKSVICGDAFLRELLAESFHVMLDETQTHFPEYIQPVFDTDWPTINKQSCVDTRLHLLEAMLVKVDRMSMAHSLEVRSPLLDHKLVEFAARVPANLKLRGWEKKALLRDVMKPQVPASILRKRKQGFCVPLREWFRNSFDELVGDYFDPASGCLPDDIFNQQTVQRVVREHQAGAADHSRKLWLLLNFAAWHEEYVGKSLCAS
jgi:asparagine synthase (glutamine-hydrolysing)